MDTWTIRYRVAGSKHWHTIQQTFTSEHAANEYVDRAIARGAYGIDTWWIHDKRDLALGSPAYQLTR